MKKEKLILSFAAALFGLLVAGVAFYLFLSIRNPFLRLLMLLLPLANAFARMSLNRHWPSDTAMSLGLGLMTAYFFWNFKEYQKKNSGPHVS